MKHALSWNPSYSVGNATLDKQHRKLLELCSQIADCVDDDGPDSSERFHRILNDVGDYTFQHFQSEEAFLSKHNYPQFAAHKREHMRFLSQLSRFLFATNEGQLDKAGLHRILSEWLSAHMLGSDMQYRDFIQAARAEPATG